MTDPKTLQEIAEQACIFDRAHFDDDTAPTVGIVKKPPPPPPPAASIAYTITLWREDDDAPFATFSVVACDDMHASQLANDLAKLNGAHSFAFIAEDFPACARNIATLVAATEQPKAAEIASVMRRNIKEQIGADPNRNLFGALADLVKERDELRKRVIVDIELPTADEIGDWIAIGESTGPIPEKGEGNIRDVVARNGLEYVVAQLKKRIPEQANIGIVKKPPPPPPPAAPPLPNELSTEIDDELLHAAVGYANKTIGFSKYVEADLVEGKRAMKGSKEYGEWSASVRGFVEGARWQLSQIERAHAGDDSTMYHPPLSLSPANGNWPTPAEISNAWFDGSNNVCVPAASRVLALFAAKQSACGSAIETESTVEPRRSYPLAPTPILFRDDAENKYWDEMTFFLARKGDTTAQSVACAADEMVEERRARMQKETTSWVQRAISVAEILRQHGMCVSAVNRIIDGRSRVAIAFGHDQAVLVFVDRPRHDRMSVADIVEEVVDLSNDIKPNPEPTEIADELLLEAAAWANSVLGLEAGPSNLETAKLAIEIQDAFCAPWKTAVRFYVAGALRKARK